MRSARTSASTGSIDGEDRESNIVLGLNLGTDDYVTKPFSIKELMARGRGDRPDRRDMCHEAECEGRRAGATNLVY